jgi:hypothetical protein
MSKTEAMAVTSSMMVAWLSFRTFSEVITMKHNPSRFEDVVRIWEDLFMTGRLTSGKDSRAGFIDPACYLI